MSLRLGDLARNGSRTLFIKVDDDIVRMERHALAYLSAHKLFHASSSFRRDGLVSANVINHGHLGYLHQALGAWHPSHEYSYHHY